MRGQVILGSLALLTLLGGCVENCYCVISEADTFVQAPADQPQIGTFRLTHFALADTIEASVGDSSGANLVPQTPGQDWTYAETDHPPTALVVFQPGALPAPESFVGVRYVCSGDCGTAQPSED